MYNHYHTMISRDFLYHLESVFQEVDRHLPSFAYNACGECRVCCTAEARLGVSELEFEYVGAYLRSKGRSQSELGDFREYIQKKRNGESQDQQSRDQQSRDQQKRDQHSRDQQSRDQQSRDQQSRDQQKRDQHSRCIENAEEAGQEKADENPEREPVEKSLKFDRCPLYDEQLKGCSIYPARPLPCRTYGYFMNSSTISLIPDFCALKPTTVMYDDATFFQHLPFCVPFYSLIYSYDDFRMREQQQDGKQDHL
ncbi:MAG: YkgJ family cysteine cluster protein [Candidatus Xenobiia bacterium LiM19]